MKFPFLAAAAACLPSASLAQLRTMETAIPRTSARSLEDLAHGSQAYMGHSSSSKSSKYTSTSSESKSSKTKSSKSSFDTSDDKSEECTVEHMDGMLFKCDVVPLTYCGIDMMGNTDGGYSPMSMEETAWAIGKPPTNGNEAARGVMYAVSPGSPSQFQNTLVQTGKSRDGIVRFALAGVNMGPPPAPNRANLADGGGQGEYNCETKEMNVGLYQYTNGYAGYMECTGGFVGEEGYCISDFQTPPNHFTECPGNVPPGTPLVPPYADMDLINVVPVNCPAPSPDPTCFADKEELKAGIDHYHAQGCPTDPECEVGQMYGYPMNAWCTSQVTDMSELFYMNSDFNEDISGWDVSGVTNMRATFKLASSFNQPIGSWNVSSVEIFMETFLSTGFNSDISGWDVSNAWTFFAMFDASSFNQPVGDWDMSGADKPPCAPHPPAPGTGCPVDGVFVMSGVLGMFFAAFDFNQDISGWNTASFTTTRGMFAEALSFNQDISGWSLPNLVDAAHMFRGADSFNQDMCAWAPDWPYGFADSAFLESGCTHTEDPQDQNGPLCAACDPPVYPCFEPSGAELKDAVDLFVKQGCAHEADCPVGKTYGMPMNSWCVKDVTTFNNLFLRYTEFNEDVSGWNMSSAQSTNQMFRDCKAFNQDLSGWDVSSLAVTQFMFSGCVKFNSPLNTWDTSSLQNMQGMFFECKEFDQDLSGWDTSSVVVTHGTFYETKSFNKDISMWNMSSVFEFRAMFYGAEAFNQDISGWDTSAATDSSYMFVHANSFNQNLCDWAPHWSYDGDALMFRETSCPDMSAPVEADQGPFCYPC